MSTGAAMEEACQPVRLPTLEELLTRDLDAWRIAKAAVDKARSAK